MPDEKLAKRKCAPCEGGVPPLSAEAARELLKQLSPSWMLIDGGRILANTYAFRDFVETMAFVNKIAALAEEEQHHPDLSVSRPHPAPARLARRALHGLGRVLLGHRVQ